MKLPIQDLTPESFAPYGLVIEQPQRTEDATGPGWQWWAENVKLKGGDRPYAVGYLYLTLTDLRFDWAERHMQSDELITPLGGDCLVYVGPADHPSLPERMPDLEQFKVFRVCQGQAVLLHPGVWHGAPLAIDQPLTAMVLLLQNTGNQDLYVQRFENNPVEIVVP